MTTGRNLYGTKYYAINKGITLSDKHDMNTSNQIKSKYVFPIQCDTPSQTMGDYSDAQWTRLKRNRNNFNMFVRTIDCRDIIVHRKKYRTPKKG